MITITFKTNEKIKIILFGSLKKIPTFALPTETKGKQKDRNGGCREDKKNEIETDETYAGRIRPAETETRRYIKRPPRGTEPNKFLKEMSM